MGSIITVSNLTHGGGNNVSSLNTNSISPVTNRLYIMSIESHTSNSTTPNSPTISGDNMTWNQVATITQASGVDTIRITIFRSLPSSPNSGVFSISFGGQSQTDINYSIEELQNIETSGSNGSGSIVQSVTNTGNSTAPSVSLAALQNTVNVSYGACSLIAGNTALNAGSGFTELANQNVIGSTILETEYAINKSNVTWTNSPSQPFASIAIEIKQKNTFQGGVI